MSRLTAAAAIVALCAAALVAPAAAAPDVEDHCVVRVVDQLDSGELVVSEPDCYSTFDAAMAAEGVDAWGEGASARVESAAATFTIGTHYDGAGFTGSSMSVVGSNCAGGWVNVASNWNNRISSTLNGCPRIRHYSGYSLTGSFESTLSPGGNLGPLNNQTSSLQYLT